MLTDAKSNLCLTFVWLLPQSKTSQKKNDHLLINLTLPRSYSVKVKKPLLSSYNVPSTLLDNKHTILKNDIDLVLKQRIIQKGKKNKSIGNLNSSVEKQGFPGGTAVNNLPSSAGDAGSVPRLGRSHREENGNPFQYSGLENPMDRGAWQATVNGVIKSWIQPSKSTTTTIEK